MFSFFVFPSIRGLLRENRSWKPKKVEEEAILRRLCETGKLKPFEQPQNYDYYFIHERTDIQLVDYLIDQAKTTNNFSMDTEDDPFSHRAATLQVEFIHRNFSSIVIIIEANYLPLSS